MDPITILTAVASLVGTALKGIQACNTYHGQYSRVTITMASMMAQCSCVEFAIIQVQEVVINNPPSVYLLRSDAALTRHFSSVFCACELVLSILNQRLKSMIDGNPDRWGQPSKMTKLKYVWNDQEMKDLLRNLESQASAINLLLAALQMRSNVEVHNLLSQKESRRLLDRVSDDASSLKVSEDTRIRESIAEVTLSGEPSLHSTFDEAEFDFDYELINTMAYRKAFYRASRQNVTQRLSGIIGDVTIPQDDSKSSTAEAPMDVEPERKESSLGIGIEETVHGDPNQSPTSHIGIALSTAGHEVAVSNSPLSGLAYSGRQQENAQAPCDDNLPHFQTGSSSLEGQIMIDSSKVALEPHSSNPAPALPQVLYNEAMEIQSGMVDAGLGEATKKAFAKTSKIGTEVTRTVHAVQYPIPNFALNELDTKFNHILSQHRLKFSFWKQCGLIEDYQLHDLVYNSASSSVFIACKDDTVDKLVLKVVNRQRHEHSIAPCRKNQIRRIHTEIAILHDLSHTNVIRIYEFMELDSYIIIVMPQISPCTVLSHILERRKGTGVWHFTEEIAWTLFKQLISGVKYLYDNQTVHHNLTLDNLLYDEEKKLIVIKGFSLAEIVPREPKNPSPTSILLPSTRVLGSSAGSLPARKEIPPQKFINPYFTAPETLALKFDPNYDLSPLHVKAKADICSCGVILLALLDGVLPYNGNMVITQFAPIHAQDHLAKITNIPLSQTLSILHRGINWGTRDILSKLLQPDHAMRYDVVQVIRHPWILARPGTPGLATLWLHGMYETHGGSLNITTIK